MSDAAIANAKWHLSQGNTQAAIDAAGPAWRASLDALVAKGQTSLTQFQRGMASIASRVGGRLVDDYKKALDDTRDHNPIVFLGPVKRRERIAEKAIADYGGDLSSVWDVVRGTIAVDSISDVPRVVRSIRQHFDVVRDRDRFDNPMPTGYRDRLINVRLPSGLIGEIQVHVKPMLRVKETGHKLYQIARKPGISPSMVARLNMQMRRIFGPAWKLAQKRKMAREASRGVHYERAVAVLSP